jgi:hypothetical protein
VAGYTTYFQLNPFTGPMANGVRPVPARSPAGRQGAGVLSPRGLRRARAASARDAARFARRELAAPAVVPGMVSTTGGEARS